MRKKFKFVGNGNHLRTHDEMLLINKKAADNAFSKYKKEILDVFMCKNYFAKYKINSYVRMSDIGLLEYINLQKERYGSKTFCVNFAVMPLYYPMEYINLGLGNRLGSFIDGTRDFWWDYSDEKLAKLSFENVQKAIQQYLFPWFDNLRNEKNYRIKLENDCRENFVGYPCLDWKNAIESNDKSSVIVENCKMLKLPMNVINSYLQKL